MNKNYIFIHCAYLDRWLERLEQYFNYFEKSSLIDHIESIFICIVGIQNINIDLPVINKYNNKIIYKFDNDLNKNEFFTLENCNNFSLQNPDCNILYLHTKGVGKTINLAIEDQVEYMLYFLIERYKDCFFNLELYDTVGVDLVTTPVLHYSGNFWWSTTNHINKLQNINEYKYKLNCLNSFRHNAEFWITDLLEGKYKSLWNSNINVYQRHIHRYPVEKYKTNTNF